MLELPEINGYEVLEFLGAGGFGTVYRARKLSADQIVAIKVLKSPEGDPLKAERSIERFNREAQLCTQLQHPHIVKLTDRGVTGSGELFAEFEFVPGQTLKEYLQSKGCLSAVEAGDLMGQVLDALSCAHAHGIIHRDLKPQNIIVTKTGSRAHVKVLDFGIGAYTPEARRSDYKSITLTQDALGTPTYSAPEQLRGELPTVKSDLYAWGLILLECLLGSAVMQGNTLAEIYHQQLSPSDVPIPPAIAIHPLGGLLRRVLQKRVEERAARADLLYADFQSLNLSNIVGKLHGAGQVESRIKEATLSGNDEAPTVDYNIDSFYLRGERRQLTSLCCRLSLSQNTVDEPEFEMLDTFSGDLLNQCIETGLMHGGFHGGTFGDCALIFFGYPYVSDDDGRRAAKTALAIADKMQRSREHMASQQNIKLEFRIGIHTGMVMTRNDRIPSGLAPNIAIQLSALAAENTVLMSAATQKIMHHYVIVEAGASHLINGNTQPLETFRLKGERDTKAHAIFHEINHDKNPIVGREQELKFLLERWQLAENTKGSNILLSGEPGIGKSRLIYELRHHVKEQATSTLVGRCLQEYKNTALFPILDILKQLLKIDPVNAVEDTLHKLEAALTAHAEDLGLVIPILCSWLSLPLPDSYVAIPHSPQKQKQILFALLKKVLLAKNENITRIIMIEDLHWADPTSLDWLNEFLPAVSSSAVLLVLTARPQFSPPWESALYSKIDLLRLPQSEILILIQKIVGDKKLDDKALSLLSERIDGVPLFAEELISALFEKNILVERDNAIYLSAEFETASIPVTLKDSLNQRLQNTGNAKETAQIAAILGREFDYDLLLQVSTRDTSVIDADLKQLLETKLVYQDLEVRGGRYIFRHALIRDSAYESLRTADRKNIHQKVAMVLEDSELRHTQTEDHTLHSQISYHYAQADHYDKAVKFGTSASESSLQRFLLDETIAQGTRVHKWIIGEDINNQVANELEINRILMQALMSRYGWADKTVSYYAERSQELSRQIDNSAAYEHAIWALATSFIYYFVKGERQGMRNVYGRIDGIAAENNNQGMQAAVSVMRAFDFYTHGEYPLAGSTFDQAIEFYIPTEHKSYVYLFGFDILVWAKATRALVAWQLGDIEGAHRLGDEAIAWARQLKHMPSLCISLLYRGIVYQYDTDKPGAKQVTEEILEIADKYGLPAYTAYATLIHYWANDNQNLDESDQIISLLQQMGCNVAMSYYASLAADLVADSGDIKGAIKRIDDCLQLCREYDEYQYDAELYRRRAFYLLRENDPALDEIRQNMEKSVLLARKKGMKSSERLSLAKLSSLFPQEYTRHQIESSQTLQ